MATWIFQGNPARFDVDDYLARYPNLVYWRTPRHAKEIAIGDRVFVWRAGQNAGAIASGVVVEEPAPGSAVRYQEALGADLWRAEVPGPDELRTGIQLQDVRLTADEGYLPRSVVKNDPNLAAATIITMPNGTVFNLSPIQACSLESLWGESINGVTPVPNLVVSEGEVRLAAHRRRERSGLLRARKIAEVRSKFGQYQCLLCGIKEDSKYPPALATRIFEVHHLLPLSKATTPVGTTLADLAVLCANCHRAVHATRAVEDNYAELERAFDGG